MIAEMPLVDTRGRSCTSSVQQWADGARYEGQFVDGLKQGGGVFTWTNGELYEGSFYKDYRHGNGSYSWPDGSRFTGKFYLNRKEGYGLHVFADGTTFQGLYRSDERFGPGVMTYADGRQDVGLWWKQWLLRLCSKVGGAFTIQGTPEYASLLPKQEQLAQTPAEGFSPASWIDTSLLDDPSLLGYDHFILPPDIHRYSTDSDHLPITRSLRRELDLLFFGRSDIITPSFSDDLPLEQRIEAHINTHRTEAEGLSWDVSAVLDKNRTPFGPKGPLELSSEDLLRKASSGDLSAVQNLLREGKVHPDVCDSGGFTALIAATVNCHDEVIHLLLDSGADVNKQNDEEMTALAVCAVLYYPLHTLHETLAERTSPADPTNTQIRAPLDLSNSPQDVSGYRGDREGVTTCQTDPLQDPSSRSSSRAEEPDAPEKAEFNESLQEAQSGAQLSEKVQQKEVRPVQLLDETQHQGEDEDGDFSRERDLDPSTEEKLWSSAGEAFDSDRSVGSFHISVTEGIRQQMVEVLCQTGCRDDQGAVHKMALMKIERQVRRSTLKLLLDRGADPNACRVPMPVLFLAIKAGDVEGVQQLLEHGARTDLPLTTELKGLYPLHVAAGLFGPPGPKITELLLHAAADPDVRAQDASEVYHRDLKRAREAQVSCGSFLGSGPSTSAPTGPADEGGRTSLHVACQRDSDYENARDVVALLLSHRANTSHLWSGHSPLSLAIASGNDLAVDELLSSGADPNLPLSRHVGSALCAAANLSYNAGPHSHSRVKLVEKLIKAGADILMPVLVGEGRRCVLGTAVDYAHHAFNQDWRVAHTPYHALTQHERETYNRRRQLLSAMTDLLRHAVLSQQSQDQNQNQGLHSMSPVQKFVFTGAGGSSGTRVRARPSTAEQGTSNESTAEQRRPLFKFCYQCGRSAWVVLSPCSRCRQVFYCSKTCKMKAWNDRHKDECIRVPGAASANGRFSGSDRQQTLSGRSSRKGQDAHPTLDQHESNKTTAHGQQHDPEENYSFI
ncbi:ankyrin repeat and MYND domain-containing protein 1 [Hoplias malabaricus]|uniref:ankyrin repeat and MYND domain-containing protein 1 n=1 Tax=Hoplias malabaricus TaxID=27720 RepID=UPI003462125E